MKNKTYLCAAVIAAFSLHSAALAAHKPGHPDGPQARAVRAESRAAPDDDSPMAWRVVRYPFRVGYTLVRTPLILGETVAGKRTFYNERGFFQANELPANDPRRSVATGRGDRTPR
jgi:hypothetical protein